MIGQQVGVFHQGPGPRLTVPEKQTLRPYSHSPEFPATTSVSAVRMDEQLVRPVQWWGVQVRWTKGFDGGVLLFRRHP